MTNSARPLSAQPLRHDKPIALRLTDAERERTFKLAQADGRSASNFARHMFLRGLADYEREQAALHPSAPSAL